jgi:hypothetical protein
MDVTRSFNIALTELDQSVSNAGMRASTSDLSAMISVLDDRTREPAMR